MKHIENAVSRTDRVVIKVMGFGNYKNDAANEYVEEAKEKMLVEMLKEDTMRAACLLQPKDTVAIYERGASFKVLPPQLYEAVVTLDADHFMFSEQRRDGGFALGHECAGLFYDDDGNAVSGSGCDVWYKVSAELIEFCTKVDKEARALSTELTDDKAELMKMQLEDAEKELDEMNVEINRTRLLLGALLGAKEQKEKEIFSKKHVLAKRKAALVEAKEKAEKAAKKPCK